MITILLSILILLILLFLLWLLLICPTEASAVQTAPFLGHSFAHRGLHGQTPDTPENSLAAFREAVAHGYGIELDIALSQDGEVVVFHDETLKRMCGVDGRIDELTLAELQKLSLAGTAERIPLFADVLALVAGQVPLIVEFKNTKTNKLLVEKALALLDDYSGAYCVESFNPFLISLIRRARPHLFRGQLASHSTRKRKRLLWFALEYLLFNIVSRPHFIAYDHRQMSNLSYRAAVRWLHAIPVAWTVRTQEDFYALYDSGVDVQIFENFLPPTEIVDEETAEPEKENV